MKKRKIFKGVIYDSTDGGKTWIRNRIATTSEIVQYGSHDEDPTPVKENNKSFSSNKPSNVNNSSENNITAAQAATYDASYAKLKKVFLDPSNEKLRDKLYENWIKRPENKGKIISKEELVNNFLEAQRQIYELQKNTNQETLRNKKWDTGTVPNNVYNKEAKRLNISPLSTNDIKTFQSTYQVLYDLADPKNSDYQPELSNFNLIPNGVNDQTYGKNKKPISPVDGWFGNTTVGQAVMAIDKPKSDIADTPTTKTAHIDNGLRANPNAPWWLQDQIQTLNAAGNLASIKKYMPWQATPNVFLPEVLFTDPTRELAANSEMANIAGQNLAQFTGPQAFNARFSDIQGKAAENAANILGRYNNMNVGISNQQSAQNASTMNNYAINRANAATSLFDKYTIANQSFDNAKKQAKDALVNQMVQGITNANYTANMNDLFPNYAVNPSVGGRDYFKNPTALNAKEDKTPDYGQMYEDLKAKHPSFSKDDLDNVWETMTGTKAPKKLASTPQSYPG